jgi:hypothetical protein
MRAKAVVAVVALQEAFEELEEELDAAEEPGVSAFELGEVVLDVVLALVEGEPGVAAEGVPEECCSAQVASIN